MEAILRVEQGLARSWRVREKREETNRKEEIEAERGRGSSSLVVVTAVSSVVVVAVSSSVVAEAEVGRALLDVGEVFGVVLDCEKGGERSVRWRGEREERKGDGLSRRSNRGGGSLGGGEESKSISARKRRRRERRRERTVAVVVPEAVVVIRSVVCSTKWESVNEGGKEEREDEQRLSRGASSALTVSRERFSAEREASSTV